MPDIIVKFSHPGFIRFLKGVRIISIFLILGLSWSCMTQKGVIETDRDMSVLPSEPFLLNGRSEVKIVCYGDSITYGFTPFTGEKVPSPYPETLETLLNQNTGKIRYRCINAGYSGQTTNFGVFNLGTLVLSCKPDIVILMYGINDCNYGMGLMVFRSNFIKMIDAVRSAGAVPVILTPTPILHNGNNSLLRVYSRELYSIAVSQGVALFDLQEQFSRKIIDIQDESIPDGIHPSPSLYPLIAELVHGYIRQMVE